MNERAQQSTFGNLPCPLCEAPIPVGVDMHDDPDGSLRLEPNLSDVWAHAWTHE